MLRAQPGPQSEAHPFSSSHLPPSGVSVDRHRSIQEEPHRAAGQFVAPHARAVPGFWNPFLARRDP